MKNLRLRIGFLLIAGIFALMLSSCGQNGGTAGSTPAPVGPDGASQAPDDPNAVTPPDYDQAEDPVMAMILFSFSGTDTAQVVRIEDDQGTVSCKILRDLLDFESWEATSETKDGEPEMILDLGEMNLELYGNLVKAQHLDVPWPTKLDFDFKWYRIPEDTDRKVHEWIETVDLDPFSFAGGTKIYKFVDHESGIYQLKNARLAQVIIRESDGAAVTEATIRDERDIDDLMQAFRDLRVMEETEKPEGTDLVATFVPEDSGQVQVHFIGECLEYEGKFYTLWTRAGFFMELDWITKGK